MPKLAYVIIVFFVSGHLGGSVVGFEQSKSGNQTEQQVLAGKRDFYRLSDTSAKTLDAQILHVDDQVAFVRRKDGRNFRIDLKRLDESSVDLVMEWKSKFSQPLTKKQREYLASIGASKVDSEPEDKKTKSSNHMMPLIRRPDPDKVWKLDKKLSDEFTSGKVNTKKWINDMPPWGDRAWSSDNVVQKDGSLFIRATYEPHTQRGTKYFYKLGILQSRKKTTYGYFEARIKGCSRFPGLCPAFWLYSNGQELNPDYPKVKYSEIDIVEMQQGIYEPKLKRKTKVDHIDCNLHCRLIDENGKEVWVRPNDSPKICKHYWNAPWDPRDDFHVYGCENTPEKIIWYIDGRRVASEKNLYWHLPMSVALTMELRPPFIDWVGVDGRKPVKEATTEEGFPTEMTVDYVRCWTPQK